MTIFATILWFLKRVAFFVIDNWKVVVPAIVLIVAVIFVYRACHKPAKINLEQIEKINNANEKERKAELQKVIEDNQDVVRTVDNRAAITEINNVEKNREIDAKVKEADKKIMEAKAQGKDVTQEELQCILVPSDCSQ